MLRPCLCGYCDLEFHLCPMFSNFVGRLSRSVLHEECNTPKPESSATCCRKCLTTALLPVASTHKTCIASVASVVWRKFLILIQIVQALSQPSRSFPV